jgi:hypothetical protein
MAQRTTALIAISILVAAYLWIFLRVAAVSELDVLPARCRRRLLWCQRNERRVYAGCIALASTALLLQVGTVLA